MRTGFTDIENRIDRVGNLRVTHRAAGDTATTVTRLPAGRYPPPMMSCFQLIDRLKHQNILTPVILMSAKIETDIAMQAINYGVTGFIKRPFQAMELIEKVQTAIDLDRKRSRQTEVAITFHQSRKSLTEREKEILDLLLRNYSSTKVGEILGLSHRTIENHRANIFQKLDLSGTPELIRLATIEETVFALLDLKN